MNEQYISFRSTRWFKLDTRSQLLAVAVTWLYVLTTDSMPFLAVLAILIMVLGIISGYHWKNYRLPIFISVLIFMQFFLMQAVFGREGNMLWHWGILAYYDMAAPLSLIAAFKVFDIMVPALLFFCSVDPEDLTLMQVKLGIPYRYAMLLAVALRFLPVLDNEMKSIYQAQLARGVPLDKSWQKAIHFFPTVMPFIFRSFRSALDTGLAMELRGFGYASERTFLNEMSMKLVDWFLVIVLLFAASLRLFYLIMALINPI